MSEPPSSPPQEVLERRGTVRLLYYWGSLRRAGIAPALSDFVPQRNPVPWENCFLITRGDTRAETNFEHVGSTLRTALEWAAEPDPLAPDLPPLIGGMIADLDQVLESGQPAEREGPSQVPSGRTLLYRAILLPFVDAHRRPHYALGAVTMRMD
jgi:hypothetical protein